MNTATVFIRLCAPLQTWKTVAAAPNKATRRHPTLNGVVGMIANAAGYDRRQSHLDIVPAAAAFRTDDDGRTAVEYRTYTGALSTKRDTPRTFESHHEHLEGACFLAALQYDPETADRIADAVNQPKRILYYGSTRFPAQASLRARRGDAPDVVAALQQAEGCPVHGQGRWALVDADPDDPDADYIADVPLDTVHRIFGQRPVVWKALREAEKPTEPSPTNTEKTLVQPDPPTHDVGWELGRETTPTLF